MMMLKIFVVLASVAATSASNNGEDAEVLDDEIALLQGQVEQTKRAGKVEAEPAEEYNLANPLECKQEQNAAAATELKVPPTDTEAIPLAPRFTFSNQPQPQSQLLEQQDPPGAAALRAFLMFLGFLLFVDGLRRWRLQRPQDDWAGLMKMSTEMKCSDEAEMKCSWAELVKAAESGDETLFTKNFNHKSLLKQADAWGCTPLHFAAKGGSTVITTELLRQGAEMDALDADCETSLHFAARAGHASACEVLLKAGAKIDVVNTNGFTPLVVAGQSNQEQACRLLTDLGAGAGGLKDNELPPLVVSQVVRKMFAA